jgi:trans-AT polyketide synthase, acyltransferase and oxidoreductase domains
MMIYHGVTHSGNGGGDASQRAVWVGPSASIAYDGPGMMDRIEALDKPCFVVRDGRGVGLTNDGEIVIAHNGGPEALFMAPVLSRRSLGDPAFMDAYGLECAYMAGSMANAISSEEMVIALGRAGLLGAFGAGGLPPARLEASIRRIQEALPAGPYAFNLIHSPNEAALEQHAVELYLQHGVRTVEASAYLALTPHVVRYRASGLAPGAEGEVEIRNRVIAKVSRREVAAHFLQPAPERLLWPLVDQGLITPLQANLAARVPMADDITLEADSGGHTDNRPLVCLLPSIIAQRDEAQARYGYTTQVRIGAAGGISTPISAFGAFMMGAAYVVTGSVNHSCVEAGTSEHVKALLAQAEMADVMMAPAADMFELGVNLQVLKRGTMFPLRARKLYELYQTYEALEAIPPAELAKVESQILQRSVDEVWEACVSFFSERDPRQIERALEHPKRKMALVFRWYLGLGTRWAIAGERGRELDYQIWCGPAMGAFNDWARGSRFEDPPQRLVAEVGHAIMDGAALRYRLELLKLGGLRLPAAATRQTQPANL